MSACCQSPCVWQRQAGVPLAVVRARQALGVADHVRQRDAVAVHQPERQPQRRLHLPRVVEDRRVARADVLDADRRPVEADRVPADRRERHELVDRAVRSITKCAHVPGQLVQLGIGRVGGERVPGGRERGRSPCSARRSPAGAEPPGAEAVVALRVRRGLRAARGSERDRLRDDRRPRGGDGRHSATASRNRTADGSGDYPLGRRSFEDDLDLGAWPGVSF